jgi:hypothetical protein
MFDKMSDLEKIETTIRIWIKWWLHWLFLDNEEVLIKNFYIDWHEHYKLYWDRDFLDFNRIFWRLKEELKEWIILDDNLKIVSIPRKENNFNDINRLYIQITDLLLWSIRFLHQNSNYNSIKYKISESIKHLLDRNWNYLNKESRFFKWFMLSEAYIENNKWIFNKINCREQECKVEQISLF